MSRYIDYDAIDYRNDRLHDKSEEFLNGVIYTAQRIDEAPSIDIVRCKECKYRSEASSICDKMNKVMLADDFCSYGKVSEIPTGSEKPNNSKERSSE